MKRVIWIVLLILLSAQLTSDPIYVTRGNIFAVCFKEPFETIYFIMENGDFYGMSIHDENRTGVSPPLVHRFLKNKGLEISDIKIIVHNHPSGMLRFSQPDIRFLQSMRRNYGFNGSYLLWANGKIKAYRDN